MENEFTKAKESMDAQKAESVEEVPAQADIPKIDEEPQEEQENLNSNNATSITLDDISSEAFIKLPAKAEIGIETDELLVKNYEKRPGKWAVNKTTKEDFWTGMTSKDKVTKQLNYQEEMCLVTDKGTINIKSWEIVSLIGSLMRYIKERNGTVVDAEKLKFFGDTVVKFKRVGGGDKTAGKNWELTCPTLNIKITEKINVTKL